MNGYDEEMQGIESDGLAACKVETKVTPDRARRYKGEEEETRRRVLAK